MQKTAGIAGASGLVGSFLLHLLLANNHYRQVIAWVRKPIDVHHPKLIQHVIDFDQLEKHIEKDKDFFQVDDVFCCLGTTIRVAKTKSAFKQVDLNYPLQIARLTNQSGAQQFLVVSSIGADVKSPFFYSQVKGEMEAGICQSGIPAIHIFQPSLLLGRRKETRFGESIAQRSAFIFSWFCRGPWSVYHPIPAEIVARAMLEIANQNQSGIHRYRYPEMKNS